MNKHIFILPLIILLTGCYALGNAYDERYRDVVIKEDKFNNSVIITMDELCGGRTEMGYDKHRCSLVYYKDNKEETYYINGNLYIGANTRGRNLYKAIDINSKELKLVLDANSGYGWYNDHYQIRLPRSYFVGDIEIKLYGNLVSTVLKISNKHIVKFLDEVDKYNSK